MKIPVYDPQINASTSQYNAVTDIRTNTLGEIADGLQQYSKFREAQLEEERKTEQFKADSAIRYELDDAHSKMLDSIQNGGAYADAEAKYQKTFNDTVTKYMPAMGDDPNVTERFQAEYKRYGLGQLVQLRNTVQARRKSDAGDAYKNLNDLLNKDYMKAVASGDLKRQEQITNFERPALVAKLVGSGAESRDGGALRIRQDTERSEALAISYIAQDSPEEALKRLEEKNAAGIFSADTYVKTRGPIIAQVDTIRDYNKAIETMNTSPTAMSEKQTALVENGLIAKQKLAEARGDQNSIDNFHSGQLLVAEKTGAFGPQFNLQFRNMAFLDPDVATQGQKKTTAKMARVYLDAPKSAQQKIDKEARVVYDMINARIDSGIEDVSAVDSVLRAQKGLPTGKQFDDFRSDVIKDLDKLGGAASLLQDQRNWSTIPFDISFSGYKPDSAEVSNFESNYAYARAMGETDSSARAIAFQDASRRNGPYMGKGMKIPPSYAYPGIVDSDFQQNAVINKLKEANLYIDKYEYVIQSDRLTEDQFNDKNKNGLPTYKIMMRDEIGALVPIKDAKGDIHPEIRTKPLDTYKDVRGRMTLFQSVTGSFGRGLWAAEMNKYNKSEDAN
jgi:hypothetical protein